MKFKYFIRGLGVGIVFTSIIFLMAYQNNLSDKMSDKDIIKKAKELGMVEKEDPIKDIIQNTEKKTTNTESAEITEKNTEQTKEKKTEGKTTEEKTTEEPTTEEKSTEEKTEKKTTEEKSANKQVNITIERGSSSFPICQKLQELGMIKDAGEFDDYLVEHGYANRISVGTHTLTIGMSFEEIAIAISDPLE